MERRLGRRLTLQYRQEMKDRWAAVESSVELTPLPDLHLLRDIGRSPGGVDTVPLVPGQGAHDIARTCQRSRMQTI